MNKNRFFSALYLK